jgi:hypothetical protein
MPFFAFSKTPIARNAKAAIKNRLQQSGLRPDGIKRSKSLRDFFNSSTPPFFAPHFQACEKGPPKPGQKSPALRRDKITTTAPK